MVSLEVVEKLAVQASPAAMHGATTQADGARGEAIVLFTTAAALTRDALSASAKTFGVPEIAVPRRIQHVVRCRCWARARPITSR